MAKAKQKGGKGGTGGTGDRTIYREFGAGENPAMERGMPDLPPNQQQVRVQTSRKGRGGKTVTVISGFQAKPETLADLLKKLKAHCGAGGAVKENEIEIQGDHRDKLVQLLNQLGYKAKGSGG